MKTFTVIITPADETRWLVSDDVLAGLLARELSGLIRSATGGPVPSVTVTPHPCACEICTHQTGQPQPVRG